MSATAIGALERGARRGPQRETVARLASALGLAPEQCAEFEAVAKSGRARSIAGAREDAAIPAAPPRSNLPAAMTSFVGRANDVAAICDQLLGGEHRLITIVGPGGVGKSRLALEVGRELGTRFSGEFWLVSLASIVDPLDVPLAITRIFGISEIGGWSLMDTLRRELRSRDSVIVLDNCEHLIEEVADVAAALLAACPGIKILATSREPLRVTGERIHSLSPLSYPLIPVDQIESALSFHAIELFCERASLVAAGGFELTTRNVRAVREIVAHLDGLPLAIELAAPMLRLISPQELATRLREGQDILAASDRNTLRHHRTLRDSIDWSYRQLLPEERLVFQSCWVFADTFSLPALIAICSSDTLTQPLVIRAFLALVDKSLIGVRADAHSRYGLLHAVHEYARELVDAAGHRDMLSRKHAEHFLRVAQQVEASNNVVSQSACIQQLEQDGANFERALRWALIEKRDPELGARLALALKLLFEFQSSSHARHWFERALQLIPESVDPVRFAHLAIALERFSCYDPDVQRRMPNLRRAVATRRELGDVGDLIQALGFLSNAYAETGDTVAAKDAAYEALAFARRLNDPRRLSWALNICALVLSPEKGEERLALLNESLDVYASFGPDAHTTFIISCMGEVEFEAHRPEQAAVTMKRALDVLDLIPTPRKSARALYLSILANCAVACGDWEGSYAAARGALDLGREIGDPNIVLSCLLSIARAGVLQGELDRGAALLGYINANLPPLVGRQFVHVRESRDDLSSLVSAGLSSEALSRLHKEGAGWDDERAIAEALRIQSP